MKTDAVQLIDACESFYRALNALFSGDLGSMEELWWHDDAVTCGQPMGSWARGWPAVREGWKIISEMTQAGSSVTHRDVSAHVHGDFGYVIANERISIRVNDSSIESSSSVTNIFKRVDGRWLMIHHHVDPVQGLQEQVVAP